MEHDRICLSKDDRELDDNGRLAVRLRRDGEARLRVPVRRPHRSDLAARVGRLGAMVRCHGPGVGDKLRELAKCYPAVTFPSRRLGVRWIEPKGTERLPHLPRAHNRPPSLRSHEARHVRGELDELEQRECARAVGVIRLQDLRSLVRGDSQPGGLERGAQLALGEGARAIAVAPDEGIAQRLLRGAARWRLGVPRKDLTHLSLGGLRKLERVRHL
mmetsp:Transcript_29480/g.87951  ORF Transcript_29480/g.87951 Transcript_29480/m.87951 type:complete len:216 (-) Transcript_29480:206-853(-)